LRVDRQRSTVIAIVVSRADSASEHVGERLLELATWTEREDSTRPDADGGGTYYRTPGFELRTFDELHLHLERPEEAFGDPGATSAASGANDAGADDSEVTGDVDGPGASPPGASDLDLLVFVSRHSGDTGPLLSAHFTGNFGPAEYGGDPESFARACPNAAAEVLDALATHAPEEYDVAMECTHHGPTAVGVPSMFVELGSDEAEWDDPAGARAVARAVLDLRGSAPDRERQVLGLGGGHYAPRFTRVARETSWAVGHVASDWQLDAMGDPGERVAVLARAFEASAADRALLEGDRPELAAAVEELGCDVVSETWLRETDGVALDVVDALESRLSTIEEGLRFGDPARSVGGADEFRAIDLPADLLAEAQGIDPDATREAVRTRAVAFETAEGGSRARGRAAVCDPAARRDLVDALADVLREKYDAVERGDDAVVARVSSFDPDLARTLGIPEGPAFGKLSAGESVEVDGRRIDPETVERERTVTFPL
jgi:D-aminoacyl-tRNA deacylase